MVSQYRQANTLFVQIFYGHLDINIQNFLFMKYWYSFLLLLCCYSSVHAQTYSRKVVLENITGTWCGLCPEGNHTAQLLEESFGANIIPIGIHIEDPMTIPTTDAVGEYYTGGGTNAFLLDRYLFPDQQFVPFTFEVTPLSEKIAERLITPPVCSVHLDHVNYDLLTRQLSIRVYTTFLEEVNNYQDLRLNLYITEDSIRSSDTGYSQTNFFNTASGYFYTGAGNPMVNYPHRHVLRAALGNVWGTASSINSLPQNIVAGTSFEHTYTYTLSETWDIDKINIIGLVQNYNANDFTDNEILNAEDISIAEILTAMQADTIQTAITPTNLQIEKIYPNPAQHQLTLQVLQKENTPTHIALYDLAGKHIKTFYSELLDKGKHQFQLQLPHLPKGIYNLRIQTPTHSQYHNIYIAQ